MPMEEREQQDFGLSAGMYEWKERYVRRLSRGPLTRLELRTTIGSNGDNEVLHDSVREKPVRNSRS